MLYIEPYFTVEPTDTEVDIGATFTLNCQAEAYPEVRMLQWQKLENNSIEYADVNGEDGIEFTIDNALISDNGTYRCVASNSILGLVYVANSSTATVIGIRMIIQQCMRDNYVLFFNQTFVSLQLMVLYLLIQVIMSHTS